MLFDVNKPLAAAPAHVTGAVPVVNFGSGFPQPFPDADRASHSSVLARARRIVLKIGTALVVGHEARQIRQFWLQALAEDVRRCQQRGQEVVIVASGAVAIGRRHLSLPDAVLRPTQKQAAASAGQVIVTQAFHAAFAQQGLQIAQLLLTCDDTEARRRHLSARSMLDQLLALGTVPLINENDATTCDASRIGDNDRLAARVAQMLRADLLVLFSDVDGLYTADPRMDAGAAHLSEVEEITPAIWAMAGVAGTRFSSGGMMTKLVAADLATHAGCDTLIANGTATRPLMHLAQGARATWFKAHPACRTGRKAWIAGALKTAGGVIVDGGARSALLSGKSLLPAGILAVEGVFASGDIIAVRGSDGIEVARGVSAYSSREAKLLAGHRSHVFERLLGFKGAPEIIHCDSLVLTSPGFADRTAMRAPDRHPNPKGAE